MAREATTSVEFEAATWARMPLAGGLPDEPGPRPGICPSGGRLELSVRLPAEREGGTSLATPGISEAPPDAEAARPVFETATAGAEALAAVSVESWSNVLPPSTWYRRHGCRWLNLALVMLTLPLALLITLPIALVNWAVFRDFRQILFRQPRVGYRGAVFSMYKFRTMAECSGEEFESWKDGADALRVTRFGRLLRNSHLDELPQFLNVLRGDMVFIGPRPEMVPIENWARETIPDFEFRMALKPGITGFAQVTQGYAGMDEEAYRSKRDADAHYRKSRGLAMDLWILIATGFWMLRGKGWTTWQSRRTVRQQR